LLHRYDWDCIQALLRITVHEGPSLTVGTISEKNPLYKNDNWPPLYGIETPSFEVLFSTDADAAAGAGTMDSGAVDTMPWYRHFLAKFPEYYDCKKAYDKAFAAGLVLKPSGNEARNDPDSVGYAEEWATYGNASRMTTNRACLANKTPRKRQLTEPATKKASAYLANVTASLDTCVERASPLTLLHPANASAIAAQVAGASGGGGVLQHLSFRNVVEQRVVEWFNEKVYAMYVGEGRTHEEEKKEDDKNKQDRLSFPMKPAVANFSLVT